MSIGARPQAIRVGLASAGWQHPPLRPSLTQQQTAPCKLLQAICCKQQECVSQTSAKPTRQNVSSRGLPMAFSCARGVFQCCTTSIWPRMHGKGGPELQSNTVTQCSMCENRSNTLDHRAAQEIKTTKAVQFDCGLPHRHVDNVVTATQLAQSILHQTNV